MCYDIYREVDTVTPTVKSAGMALMDRWNAGKTRTTEMAVMGHQEDVPVTRSSYKFFLSHQGGEYEVTVAPRTA